MTLDFSMKFALNWLATTLGVTANLSARVLPLENDNLQGRKKLFAIYSMSHHMRIPTMWYVQPAKPQTSLRIQAV